MRRSIYTVFVMILLLSAPLIPLLVREGTGGSPMFSGNLRAVSGYNANRTQRPFDMEVDSGGRIYLLYESDSKFLWGIFITHSDDGGVTWSEPVRVDDLLRDFNASNDEKDQLNPRMAIAGNDTVYVVWEDWREFIDDSEPMSRPSKISISWAEDGENFTRPVKVDPYKEQKIWHAYMPDIEILDSGRIFVCWQDRITSGAWKNIFGAYSDDYGVSWSTPVVINHDDFNSRNHDYPRVAAHGNHVYVTWHDGRSQVLGVQPFLSVSNDGGETFSPEININDDIEEFSRRNFAVPAVDDNGVLYIVWTDYRSLADEIFFTKSVDNGQTLAGNKKVATAPEETADRYPCISAYGDGVIAVVWEREIPTQDNSEKDVYFRISKDGGSTWNNLMRVDDSDRNWLDLTDQEKPIVTFDADGRVLTAWEDGRIYEPAVLYRDIFFARYSQTITGTNLPPEILRPSFRGYGTRGIVGNGTSMYNFTFTYEDWDNDRPVDGYPRIQIFGSADGSEPYFETWQEMWKTNGSSDRYYMEGVDYSFETNIDLEGDFFWQIQVVEERDDTVISSKIMPGPRIDKTEPVLEMISPVEMTWMPTDQVMCRVRISDSGGAHINPASVKFQKSTSGVDSFEAGVAADGFEVIDGDTIEAWAMVTFQTGVDNYIRFEAKDYVNNGPAISGHLNLWLDPDPPYYTQVLPDPRDYQLYAHVNCSVVWRDSNPGNTNMVNIGLDPTTIMYSYRTTTDAFSDWYYPDGYVKIANDSYRAWVTLQFKDKGIYNFIRWRAGDYLMNNFTTPELRVNVRIPENYPPMFLDAKAYPNTVASETPHLFWEGAFDEEGDPLEYSVLLMDWPSRLWRFSGARSTGDRTFFDVPESEALPPGSYIILINVTDNIGGWDVMEHRFRITETGTPPPSEVAKVGPFFLSDPNGTVEWTHSPSAGGRNITYWIRVGTSRFAGDITEWIDIGPDPVFSLSELSLSIGIYSFQVMTHSDGNFSRVTEGMIKISDYEISVVVPDSHDAYRGEGWSKAKLLQIKIANFGLYADNVTVIISGQVVDEGWAELSKNQQTTAEFEVPSSKDLSETEYVIANVLIKPERNAQKGIYNIRVTCISEENSTFFESNLITINVSDAPEDSRSSGISDDLYNLLTDIFPFLDGVPQGIVIAIFFLIVIGALVVIVAVGILITKKTMKKSTADDPYADQRKLYKELYGIEPSMEQLQAMKAGGEKEGEGVIGGVDLSMIPDKPETTLFDESFLSGETQAQPETDAVPEEAADTSAEQQEPPEESWDGDGADDHKEDDFMTPD
ncbi:MAG: sialidase family protein [Thermoplasmatota archaeon]